MKCILLADNRPDLLATLEPILKHWGYRILAATNPAQAVSFLHESDLSLLIVGRQLLGNPDFCFPDNIVKRLSSGNLPLLEIEQQEAAAPVAPPLETLSIPVDVFTLFSFIQRFVEKHPRQNLRLRLRIPGMYKTHGSDYTLADVFSVSMNGLFFKAAARLEVGDSLSVVIPLLGHCKELEVGAKILYIVQPETRNNYMQGFGVGFENLSANQQVSLQKFIEERFLAEVSNCQAGVGDFCVSQLRR